MQNYTYLNPNIQMNRKPSDKKKNESNPENESNYSQFYKK